MAVMRKSPYAQFNFLVDFGNGTRAGFQECSGLHAQATVADYRHVTEKENSVRKVPGLNKSTNVTLKRGIVDSQSLSGWLNDIREANKAALRTVVIRLQNEDHKTVEKWKLRRARISKHNSGPMNAKGTDVAMEELTLAYGRLEKE